MHMDLAILQIHEIWSDQERLQLTMVVTTQDGI